MMKRFLMCITVLAASIQYCDFQDKRGGSSKIVSLFDGKAYAGSGKALSVDEFLVSEKTYKNFILWLQVKGEALETNGLASCEFRLRSQKASCSTQMIGYHADNTPGLWDTLYDENNGSEAYFSFNNEKRELLYNSVLQMISG